MGACGVLLESDWIDLGRDDGDVGEPCDEGKPPDVNSEELAALDEAAGYEEISRLLEMKVILRSKRAKRRCLFPNQKGLDDLCNSSDVHMKCNESEMLFHLDLCVSSLLQLPCYEERVSCT